MKSKRQAIYIFLFLFAFCNLFSCISNQKVIYAAKLSKSGYLPRNGRMALLPSGGLAADALGQELLKRGLTVVDRNGMIDLLLQLKIKENDLFSANNLALLKEQGIDAIIMVVSVINEDSWPQNIDVIILNTENGKKYVQITWQNGKGTIIDDQSMIAGDVKPTTWFGVRRSIPDVAGDIVHFLFEKIGTDGRESSKFLIYSSW